jgi:hypothetical protein
MHMKLSTLVPGGVAWQQCDDAGKADRHAAACIRIQRSRTPHPSSNFFLYHSTHQPRQLHTQFGVRDVAAQ